jgi:DNA repair exonuclease SbcCD ATPase subunit
MAEVMGLTAEMYRAVVTIVDERVKEIRVTREDFNELKGAVQELAQAQARTEQRMGGLERAMLELAQAQMRTEQRIDELAQAQARTEQRIDELAQAQARTEQRVDELAQAQARTEQQIEKLVEAQQNLAQQVGRLSDTIGFGLEDIAKVVLPGYLYRHFGIRLEGVLGEELNRHFFHINGTDVEINLYGEGERDGQRVVVLGEAKSRICGNDVEKFTHNLAVMDHVLKGEVVRVMFGYFIHPSAEVAARERDILVVASYQR